LQFSDEKIQVLGAYLIYLSREYKIFTLHDFNCNSRTLHTALVVAIQEFKVSCFVYWNMENLLDLFVFILSPSPFTWIHNLSLLL
jgi:hypothetical protein